LEKQEKDDAVSTDAVNPNSSDVFTVLARIREMENQHPDWFAPKRTTPTS